MIVVEGMQRSIKARLKKIQRKKLEMLWVMAVGGGEVFLLVKKHKYASFDRKCVEKMIHGNDF